MVMLAMGGRGLSRLRKRRQSLIARVRPSGVAVRRRSATRAGQYPDSPDREPRPAFRRVGRDRTLVFFNKTLLAVFLPSGGRSLSSSPSRSPDPSLAFGVRCFTGIVVGCCRDERHRPDFVADAQGHGRLDSAGGTSRVCARAGDRAGRASFLILFGAGLSPETAEPARTTPASANRNCFVPESTRAGTATTIRAAPTSNQSSERYWPFPGQRAGASSVPIRPARVGQHDVVEGKRRPTPRT